MDQSDSSTESNMDEQINSATMKQEPPKPIQCVSEEPEPELSEKLSLSKLPLKPRNLQFITDRPKFVCSSCGLTFKAQKSLTEHYNTNHTELDHFCPVCGKGFLRWVDLEKHALRHNPQNKRTTCDYCIKKFYSRGDVIGHIKVCHKEKTHKCLYCEKRYLWTINLKAHEKTHRK